MFRTVRGYTDLGPIIIPFRSQYIVMVDRADGREWLLVHNLTVAPPDGHIAITDVLPSSRAEITRFGPYDGPYVQPRTNAQEDRVIRLLIRSGFLGYEMVEQQGITGQAQARVLTRRDNSRTRREVLVPTAWATPGDVLSWTTEIK